MVTPEPPPRRGTPAGRPPTTQYPPAPPHHPSGQLTFQREVAQQFPAPAGLPSSKPQGGQFGGLPTVLKLLGVLAALLFAFGFGVRVGSSKSQGSVVGAVRPPVTVTSTVTITSAAVPYAAGSSTPTPTDITTQQNAQASTSSRPTAPRGGVTVAVPIAAGYGQGFGSGRCTTWRVLVMNGTNIELTSLTITPTNGAYSPSDYSREVPASPIPVVLDLSVPAHSQQGLRFEVCTKKQPPGPSWEYNTSGGLKVETMFVNGYRGKATFSVQ